MSDSNSGRDRCIGEISHIRRHAVNADVACILRRSKAKLAKVDTAAYSTETKPLIASVLVPAHANISFATDMA